MGVIELTASAYESVPRSGIHGRSVVITLEDGGRSYARHYFGGDDWEDYEDGERVECLSSLSAEHTLMDAWLWIGDEARRYLRTGSLSSHADLMEVLASL